MNHTRRTFLKAAGAGVSIAVLGPSLDVLAAPQDGRSIVVLQLAGGNDALNTVIPFADARYRSLRPTLAIPDGEIIRLDDRIGVHPSLAKFAGLYRSGKAAFVTGVGFPSLDRSHFHCQDVWQSGIEGDAHDLHSSGGWLGRLADTYLSPAGSPLVSLAIGSKIPLGMSGHEVFPAAISDPATFDVATDTRYADDRAPFVAALEDLYAGMHGDESPAGMIRRYGGEMFDSIDLVKLLPPADPLTTYPATALGRAMSFAARSLSGPTGTRLVWVTAGGYDTHNNQLDTHAALLSDVSESLAAFWSDAERNGFSDRVVVMGWSEFGRRAQENASNGTDHGKAGTVFLLGGGVKGGAIYGDVPDLGSLDQGDLRNEIDFRSVYSTLIQDWMKLDPHPVLHGHFENLGFISRGAPPRRRSAR
ncbi:MAG: DUF1501 domain-containing protein [Thermoanaerobaculia bacterium]